MKLISFAERWYRSTIAYFLRPSQVAAERSKQTGVIVDEGLVADVAFIAYAAGNETVSASMQI